MDKMKKEIQAQLEQLKEMINIGKSAEEIEEQRKVVDKLLKEYLKEL